LTALEQLPERPTGHHLWKIQTIVENVCLVSWTAAPCVWTLRAPTRNLVTYLLADPSWNDTNARQGKISAVLICTNGQLHRQVTNTMVESGLLIKLAHDRSLQLQHSAADYTVIWLRNVNWNCSRETAADAEHYTHRMMMTIFSSCLSTSIWAPVIRAIESNSEILLSTPHAGIITFLHLQHQHKLH